MNLFLSSLYLFVDFFNSIFLYFIIDHYVFFFLFFPHIIISLHHKIWDVASYSFMAKQKKTKLYHCLNRRVLVLLWVEYDWNMLFFLKGCDFFYRGMCHLLAWIFKIILLTGIKSSFFRIALPTKYCEYNSKMIDI